MSVRTEGGNVFQPNSRDYIAVESRFTEIFEAYNEEFWQPGEDGALECKIRRVPREKKIRPTTFVEREVRVVVEPEHSD